MCLIDYTIKLLKIKDMNDVVENLKVEKDQLLYKLQQYDNVIDCQKLEIESKASLLKQFDFVIMIL